MPMKVCRHHRYARRSSSQHRLERDAVSDFWAQLVIIEQGTLAIVSYLQVLMSPQRLNKRGRISRARARTCTARTRPGSAPD